MYYINYGMWLSLGGEFKQLNVAFIATWKNQSSSLQLLYLLGDGSFNKSAGKNVCYLHSNGNKPGVWITGKRKLFIIFSVDFFPFFFQVSWCFFWFLIFLCIFRSSPVVSQHKLGKSEGDFAVALVLKPCISLWGGGEESPGPKFRRINK